ncbi:hypothetical protein FEI17_16940 [Kosakonia radicincitans]|uniref:hypothetical protein n=1 Tax=Kosakonia radicincitans TaxID=283686 RepID=UPI0011EBDF53|nr:hypothetical protein [Kosakonia radicincitans]QEM92211.1 hypothetical protein FEI17_16940 [Kosakonia radicincitans]
MDTVSTNHNIGLLSMNYESQTSVVYYCLSVQGKAEYFSAKISDNKGIRGIAYTDGLDELIMSVIPLNPKISRVLGEITWDYIEGREVIFPIQLVP